MAVRENVAKRIENKALALGNLKFCLKGGPDRGAGGKRTVLEPFLSHFVP
jgi:hypothetical protein